MPTLPQIPTAATYNEITDAFAGYNHNLKIADGEYFDTQNLTTEYYPLMADRKKRGILQGIPEDVGGLIDKDELYYVAAGSLYRRGNTVALMSGLTPGEKQLVSMGAYICIFPDKMYYNTADGSDHGDMRKTLTDRLGGAIRVWKQKNGDRMQAMISFVPQEYGDEDEFRKNYLEFLKNFSVGSTIDFYTNPGNTYGLNGRQTISRLKFEDGTAPIKFKGCDPTTGEGTGTGADEGTSPFFKAYYNGDGTTWLYFMPEPAWSVTEVYVNGEKQESGWEYSLTSGATEGVLVFASGSTHLPPDEGRDNVMIVYKPKLNNPKDTNGDKQNTFIVFDAAPDELQEYPLYNTNLGNWEMRSYFPEMDYICEAQNRLWGCRYGPVGDQLINELYCCALGDFSKWDTYEGTSMDSWTASVGSDGPWTGCVNYMGYPTFFKEDRLYRIAISPIGAHEYSELACRGVQQGSHRSLQVVNETLYYKSPLDVCAYQGGFPASVSEKLGDVKYSDAAAGVFGDRYYISMQNTDGEWDLFVYDTARGLWIREDNTQAISFATVGNELYCAPADGGILALQGTDGEEEEHVDWYAESGILYYQYPNRKYVSRFNLRLQMERGARMRIFLEYDSSGRWEKSGEIIFQGTNTIMIPVRPRRCDHLRIRIEGRGRMKIFSWARVLEIGSDY